MKYMLLMIILFSSNIQMYAQHTPYEPKGENWPKEIAGQYGNMDGIALFDDGTFILYGYATIVLGKYEKEKTYLKFTTEKLDTILVFGHKNPALVGKSTMVFSGFENGSNFIQFDSEMPQRVFNENANCFDSPFIFDAPEVPSKVNIITVSDRDDQHASSWTFSNDHQYNEFVFIHNQPKRAYEDFFGGFYQDEGGKLNIQLSHYGGEKGYKRRFENDENEQWPEILELRSGFEQMNDFQDDYFVNPGYSTFSAIDLSQYTFNESSNEFLKIGRADNELYYDQNAYNDDRVLRKLEPISLIFNANFVLSKDKIKPGSIFYTTCEEPDKSYKNPNHHIEEHTDARELMAIPPVPIPDKK